MKRGIIFLQIILIIIGLTFFINIKSDGNRGYIVFLLEVLMVVGNSLLMYTIDTNDEDFLINVIAGIAWFIVGVVIVCVVISGNIDSSFYGICGCNLGIYSAHLFLKNFGGRKLKGIPICNIVIHLQKKTGDLNKIESTIDSGILAVFIAIDIFTVSFMETGFVKSLFDKVMVLASVFFIVYTVCLNILYIMRRKDIIWREILILTECLVLVLLLLLNKRYVMFEGYVFYLMTQAVLLGEFVSIAKYKLRCNEI